VNYTPFSSCANPLEIGGWILGGWGGGGGEVLEILKDENNVVSWGEKGGKREWRRLGK
jgi:hypothetical protein